MSTLTVYPAAGAASPVDGPINEVNVDMTFATIRASAGNQGGLESTSLDRHAGIDGSTTTSQYKSMNRGFYDFDTSPIGTGQTISSSTFSLLGNFKTNGMGSGDIYVCANTVTSSSSLPSTDFPSVGSTSFGSITYANWLTSATLNDFTLNASGIAAIAVSGITKLATRIDWDMNNTTTGLTWSSGGSSRYESWFADAGGTSRPKLVVVYAPAAVASTVTDTASNLLSDGVSYSGGATSF